MEKLTAKQRKERRIEEALKEQLAEDTRVFNKYVKSLHERALYLMSDANETGEIECKVFTGIDRNLYLTMRDRKDSSEEETIKLTGLVIENAHVYYNSMSNLEYLVNSVKNRVAEDNRRRDIRNSALSKLTAEEREVLELDGVD